MINLEKILCPTDFSENSKTAQMYAYGLAKELNAELHLIHIVADPSTTIPPFGWGYIPDSFLTDMKGQSDTALGKVTFDDDNITIVRKTIEGMPASDIVNYADNHGINLIVMGTHGHSPVMDFFVGSVTEKVIRRANCPVLTMHPDDHQFIEAD